jgi:ankyrin repeat protein
LTPTIPFVLSYLNLNIGFMDTPDESLAWAQKVMNARTPRERDRLLVEGRFEGASATQRRKALFKHAIDYDDLPLLEQLISTQIARALLKLGADPNRPSSSGYPPIYGAASPDHIEMLTLLIDAGADVNRMHSKDASALAYACLNGFGPIVKTLLAAGANINQPGKLLGMQGGADQMTPLMVAAMWGHAQVVKLLLAADADITAKDSKGHTALDWAQAKKSKKHLKTAALLTAAGAQAGRSAEDLDALEPDFSSAARQSSFIAAVKKLKSITQQPRRKMCNLEGPIAGPVAFLLPEARAKAIVADHQEEFLLQGHYLLHTRDTTDENGDAVAIFPTANVYEVLAALQTEGANSKVYNRDLIHWLRGLTPPLRITGTGNDFLAGHFTAPIPDPAALMKSIAKICPDADEGPDSLRTQAHRLAETRELFLWWD